jgi:nucleotide-binding universal stress UspA family protein
MNQNAKKVLMVAVDFSECSDDALKMGLTMLQQGQVSTLHLIHVLDPRDVIDHPEKPAIQTEEEVIEVAPRMLLARANVLVPLNAADRALLKPHARIGRTVPTLIQACVDYEADMLIVGTHARRGMQRLLLGSVSEALVREAPCPVLIARATDYKDRVKTALPDQAYLPGEEPAPSEVPFEHTQSTSSDSWRPSDNGPTGFRIV